MAKTPTKKRNPVKKKLAPQVDPQEPTGRLTYIPVRQAGVRVTEDTVLTLGAFWACVRYISESIAGLPWDHLEKSSNGGRNEVEDSTVGWLIGMEANPETPAFQWRETILAHALVWGNGYAEIERDMMGRPVNMWQIAPDRVTLERAESGGLVYTIYNYGSAPTYLDPKNVFHLRGLGFDGLIGYNLARLAARCVGAGIALEQSVAEFFANDSTPGGVLKSAGKLNEQAQANLRTSWMRRHAGPSNKRMIAILEQGMEYQQIGTTPENSQLTEQRQLTPAEICRWFRVPPHKIGDLARATFSNIEQQSIEAVVDCLLPWARRLEGEANVKLFGRTNRGRHFTRLDFRALLRGDTQARSAFYTAMLDRGVFDINEVRGWEDLNPIGPDGAKRFVQANMQLLEKAGEEPPQGSVPQPAEEPESEPEAEQEPEDGGDLSASLAPVIEDAWRRIINRERDRMESVRKRGKLEEWLPTFAEEQKQFAARTLQPIRRALKLESVNVEGYAADIAKRGQSTSPVEWDASAVEYSRAFMESLNARAG